MEDNNEKIKSNIQFAQRAITIIVTSIAVFVSGSLASESECFREDKVMVAVVMGCSSVLSYVIVDFLFTLPIIFVLFLFPLSALAFYVIWGMPSNSVIDIALIFKIWLILLVPAILALRYIEKHILKWIEERGSLRWGMILIAISLAISIISANYIYKMDNIPYIGKLEIEWSLFILCYLIIFSMVLLCFFYGKIIAILKQNKT